MAKYPISSKSTSETPYPKARTSEEDLSKDSPVANRSRQHCLEAILDNTNTPVFLKNYDLNYVYINRSFEQLGRVTLAQVQGKNDYAVFPKPIADIFRAQDEEVLNKRVTIEFEETVVLPDGLHTFITSKFPLFTLQEEIAAVGGICTDITSRKQAEEALKECRKLLEKRVAERTAELDGKTRKLQEANNALNVLLEKREEDRRQLEEGVMDSIEKLVFPYLDKIKNNFSDSFLKSQVEILRSNLEDITSSFRYNQKNLLSHLTPTQVEVACLIKLGYTTKEIASHLNLSPSTIACHRQEIRRRLGITNQKVNLQSILREYPDNYKA